MTFDNIFAMGDIHGSYKPIENFWLRNKDLFKFRPNNTVIILLGDVGTNYYLNNTDKKFKKKLSSFPFTYFCVRGNHEERISNVVSNSPMNWYEEKFFDNTVFVERDYPNIKYALDTVSFYNIEGLTALVLPGAYSADKYYRLERGWNWFKDEQLTKEEMELGKQEIEKHNYKTDLVFSHTCPVIYEPTDLFLPIIDQSTVDKSMERYLGEIEFKLDYKLWLWGHYHKYRVYPEYEGKQCIMLSAGQEAINVMNWIKYPKKEVQYGRY